MHHNLTLIAEEKNNINGMVQFDSLVRSLRGAIMYLYKEMPSLHSYPLQFTPEQCSICHIVLLLKFQHLLLVGTLHAKLKYNAEFSVSSFNFI